MKTAQKQLTDGGTQPGAIASPATDELVVRYLPLVRRVANKIHRRLPRGVDLQSLIHAGVIGLLEALARFDPQRGTEFEVYARYRIHGEVMECLRSFDWVSRSVRSWERKIAIARTKIAGKLFREPTAEELSEELAVSLENYFRLDDQVNKATLFSLEVVLQAAESERAGTQETIVHLSSPDPLSLVERKDLISKLSAAVENLSERERLILKLYHYEDLTFREIGEFLKLSEARICQIFGQIVKHLRNVLEINLRSKCCAPVKRPAETLNGKRLSSRGVDWISRTSQVNPMLTAEVFSLSLPSRKPEVATIQQA